MDEMTEVRRLRGDAPVPDRARLAPGRRRLAEATAKRSAGRGLRTDWRLAAVGAVAVVAAVAVLVATTVGGHGGDARPGVTTVETYNAKRILLRAADTIAREPAPHPHEGQWVYTRVFVRNTTDSKPPKTQEHWTKYADPNFEHGRQGDDHSPRETYAFLSALPDDPGKALARIRRYYPAADGEPEFEHDFRAAMVLSQAYPYPPEGMARVYRALAAVPGLKAETAQDVTGRPALAIYRKAVPKGYLVRTQVLLEPRTFDYLGARYVSTVTKTNGDGSPAFRRGDVIIDEAMVKHALVSRHGERP
jgi:hypothetical protein